VFVARFELFFDSDETRIRTIMRFNFEADGRFDPEGDWEAADPASRELALIYLGKADGSWDVKTIPPAEGSGRKPFQAIWMREYPDPSGIQNLWKSMPDMYASIHDPGNLPLSTGRSGRGRTMGWPFVPFGWRIIAV
jgi:hypothetical protein